MKKLCLNEGCGNVPLKSTNEWDYINIDKYYYPDSKSKYLEKELSEKWDLENPSSSWVYGDIVKLDYESESFDKVLMVHVLEHVSMEDGNKAISEAHRVLKTNCFIEIEVPDLIRACEYLPKVTYSDEGEFKLWYQVMGMIYGTTGDDGDGQYHLFGYTKQYLYFKLNERGFINIEEIPVGFGHGIDDGKGHPQPDFNYRVRAQKK